MEEKIENDFECVADGCTNRVSVYDDSNKCVSCREGSIREVYGIRQ